MIVSFDGGSGFFVDVVKVVDVVLDIFGFGEGDVNGFDGLFGVEFGYVV